ncbi:MAG: hypothetical protein K1X92_12640 [Bacteroidia bacterium]|nr:hypothetical protein [Bacteroidia bacterium]
MQGLSTQQIESLSPEQIENYYSYLEGCTIRAKVDVNSHYKKGTEWIISYVSKNHGELVYYIEGGGCVGASDFYLLSK